MGSGGYKRAKPKWRSQNAVVSTGSSEVNQNMDPRAIDWILGHSKEDPNNPGVYLPASSEVSGVLERVVQKAGEVGDGQEDVLTAAIGTKEHGGRVRGYSSYETQRTVFGKGTRSRQSRESVIAEMEARVQAEIQARVQLQQEQQAQFQAQQAQIAQLQAQMQAMLEQQQQREAQFQAMLAQQQPQVQLFSQFSGFQISPRASLIREQGSSNHVVRQLQMIDTIEVDTSVYLFLHNNRGEIVEVGCGVAHPVLQYETMVGSLESGQVCVTVDDIKELFQEWPVPFPPPEGKLGHYVGHQLRWSKNLIERQPPKDTVHLLPSPPLEPQPQLPIEPQLQKKKKPTRKGKNTRPADRQSSDSVQKPTRKPLVTAAKLRTLGGNSRKMHDAIMAQSPSRHHFVFSNAAFKFSLGVDGTFWLYFDDIREIFHREWASISIVKAWTW